MDPVRDNIAAMQGYVPGEQPRGRRYIKLNTNENPYPPSPAVFHALGDFDPERLRLYPEPLSVDIRTCAAALFGLESAEWAICGNGSDDLLTIALRTFVGEGDRLAYPSPSYSLYPILGDIQGARHRAVPLDDAFELPDDLEATIAGARLLLLARPNAPTGNAFPLARIQALCEAFDGVVWIDEAYADFADDHCVGLVRRYSNVVVSRTLSKSYSLAGARLGIAFACPELVGEMLKVKDSYNVSMLTQLTALAALQDQEHMIRTRTAICRTRTRTAEALGDLGFSVLPSQTNFLLAKPPVPAVDVMSRLRDAGFLVRHFPSDPRVADYLRITMGTDDDMDAFVAALAHILSA